LPKLLSYGVSNGLFLATALWFAAGCGSEPPPPKADMPVPVVAETATVRPVADMVNTVGRVEAESVSTVGSQLPGRIVLMTRDVGDLVPGFTGDNAEAALLARLDTDALEAQAKRLEAEVKLAAANLPTLKSEYDRQQSLLEAGSGTEQRRDQAKMAYEVALARVEAARAAHQEVRVQIRQSSITAPMDAVVVKKFANVGDVVSPMFSPQLYQLECIRDLKIQAIVPERDVPQVQARKEAAITFDALPGRHYTGQIHAMIPSGDPLSHSFTAEIRFRNRTEAGELPAVMPPNLTPDDLLIKPGMFARVQIIKARKPEAVVVPRRCIVEEGKRSYVYTIDADSRARKVEVATGMVTGTKIEIVRGVEPGTQLVGRGIENVTQGQPVRVIPRDEPKP
jgi:membrane fusion protein, multidrug efflux system